MVAQDRWSLLQVSDHSLEHKVRGFPAVRDAWEERKRMRTSGGELI